MKLTQRGVLSKREWEVLHRLQDMLALRLSQANERFAELTNHSETIPALRETVQRELSALPQRFP